MIIRLLGFEDLPQAAALFGRGLARLRKTAPALPEQVEIQPRLARLVEQRLAWVAIEGKCLIGYLGGFPLEDLKGSGPAVYVPEWGHAAEPAAKEKIYTQLYAAASAGWVGQGRFQHAITILADDQPVRDCLYELGFGLQVEDAVRPMLPLEIAGSGVEIRLAGPSDAPLLTALEGEYAAYMAEAPIFLPWQGKDETAQREWLAQPGVTAWIAIQDGQPAGYLMCEPGAELAILDGEKTARICGAYIRPAVRGRGLMTALLDRALRHYQSRGYKRCAVDYETQNRPAVAFWRRHFTPVAQSVIRRVDERIGPLL